MSSPPVSHASQAAPPRMKIVLSLLFRVYQAIFKGVSKLCQSQVRCHNLKMGLLPSAFLLMWGSAFWATAHDALHGAFMTLPAYTRMREGEAPQLGSGPTPWRPRFCVRPCPLCPVNTAFVWTDPSDICFPEGVQRCVQREAILKGQAC